MIIMMSAPCTQEVGRSTRNLDNLQMDRFTSPVECTCVITGRMNAVCDEHGNHSCAQTMDVRSDVDEETENQRAELGGHQHLNARGILARTRCRQCPHGVPCPFGSFLSDRWRHLILRIANGPDRNYSRWWQRMEIHARHVHISVQLLVSLLHLIIASVSALMVTGIIVALRLQY